LLNPLNRLDSKEAILIRGEAADVDEREPCEIQS
jgi:hypothetical protein